MFPDHYTLYAPVKWAVTIFSISLIIFSFGIQRLEVVMDRYKKVKACQRGMFLPSVAVCPGMQYIS